MSSNDPLMNIIEGGVAQARKMIESLRTADNKLDDIAAVLRCERDKIIPRLIALIDEHAKLKEEIAEAKSKLSKEA